MADPPPINSNPADQIIEQHQAIGAVFDSRLLGLKAIQSLWEHQSPGRAVEHIIKTDNNAVTVDVLSHIIIPHLQKENTPFSISSCMQLVPLTRGLLETKYEYYITTALDFLSHTMNKWWAELVSVNQLENRLRLGSQSIRAAYTCLVSLTDRVTELSKRSGVIGEKATALAALMNDL